MKAIQKAIQPDQIRVLSLVLIIILALFFFSTQIDNYFSPRLFNRITTSVAILLVVAVGQTLVVLTRNIDLSVGSIVGFTAYFVGTQLAENNEIAPLVAACMAVGAGALMGALNGIITAYGRVPAIITTLGTLALYRTFLVQYSNSQSVITSSLPQWLIELPTKNFLSFGDLDLRTMVIWALLILLLFQLLIAYLPWGRRLYAIGSNPEAAHLSGLPVERHILSAFIICGALSGLAGFMFLARFGNVTVVAALGLELQVVAAVVVGGVNIFGGSGSMTGALLGTILIATLEQSLLRWRIVSEFWRDALLGLLILLAVAADAVILDRVRLWWARGEIEMAEGENQLRN